MVIHSDAFCRVLGDKSKSSLRHFSKLERSMLVDSLELVSRGDAVVVVVVVFAVVWWSCGRIFVFVSLRGF